MDSRTSIGQRDQAPNKNADRATQATTEGVDAQNANEFDLQHGLAGAEAKPLRKGAARPDKAPDGDKERERLEPGSNAGGHGDTGAN